MPIGYFQFDAEGWSVAIVAKDFWEKHQHLADSNAFDPAVEAAIPDGFYELTDAIYETDFDTDEAKAKLVSAGFEERVLFTNV